MPVKPRPIPKERGQIREKTLREQIESVDTRGYNAETLKGFMVMNGHNPSTNGLAKIMGVAAMTAYKRLRTGRFYRLEILQIMEELNLTPEQMIDIFFDPNQPGNMRETIPNSPSYDENGNLKE